MEIVNCRLRAREQKSPPRLGEYPVSPLTLSDCLKAYRPAYISRENTIREVPIYNGQILRPGTWINEPAIIEEELTTILIPPDFAATKDQYLNYVLIRKESSP